MPKILSFNDIVQNKIKDYVGTQRWSNSQFAAKYSDAYAKIYGKMEAPSSSTSRKLVEEKGHEYSEKECIVLERLTAIFFHKMWLEEQRNVLLKKMDDYSLSHGEVSSDHERAFDTELQIGDLARKCTRLADSLSIDDLSISISRYIHIETRMPLILLCDTATFGRYLVGECARNALYVDADKLLDDGADYPNNVIYTSLKVSPSMNKEMGKCINDALKVIYGSAAIGNVKHVIVIIESYKQDDIVKALSEWHDTLLLVQFHWTYRLMQGWVRIEDNAGRMHPILKEYIVDKITEIETCKYSDGSQWYRPGYDYFNNLHSVAHMNLDKGEEPLLMEYIKADFLALEMCDYLISRIFNTDDDDKILNIRLNLERVVLSQRPTIPENTRNQITECLSVVKTWPEIFKDEVRCWMDQAGSLFVPKFDYVEEWMDFLMEQYEKQQEWLDEEDYLSALNILKKDGFPIQWFSDSCDQKSLLTAMITYPEWKESFPHDKDFELKEYQYILLTGAPPSLDAKGWKRWFERNYNRNLVSYNYSVAIEVYRLRQELGRVP